MKTLPQWRKLSEFVGQTITLTGEMRNAALPDGRTIRLARMENGEEIIVPEHVEVVDTIKGSYRVRSFPAKKYGTTGYSLVNA